MAKIIDIKKRSSDFQLEDLNGKKTKSKSLIYKSCNLTDFEKHTLLYKKGLMDRNIREIDTNYNFKIVSKGFAIFFFVCFGFIAIVKCIKNLPIQNEILYAASTSAYLIDVNKVLTFFKRVPPQ